MGSKQVLTGLTQSYPTETLRRHPAEWKFHSMFARRGKLSFRRMSTQCFRSFTTQSYSIRLFYCQFERCISAIWRPVDSLDSTRLDATRYDSIRLDWASDESFQYLDASFKLLSGHSIPRLTAPISVFRNVNFVLSSRCKSFYRGLQQESLFQYRSIIEKSTECCYVFPLETSKD